MRTRPAHYSLFATLRGTFRREILNILTFLENIVGRLSGSAEGPVERSPGVADLSLTDTVVSRSAAGVFHGFAIYTAIEKILQNVLARKRFLTKMTKLTIDEVMFKILYSLFYKFERKRFSFR